MHVVKAVINWHSISYIPCLLLDYTKIKKVKIAKTPRYLRDKLERTRPVYLTTMRGNTDRLAPALHCHQFRGSSDGIRYNPVKILALHGVCKAWYKLGDVLSCGQAMLDSCCIFPHRAALVNQS